MKFPTKIQLTKGRIQCDKIQQEVTFKQEFKDRTLWYRIFATQSQSIE